jgi:HD-GYP domain-containing protein (c-di-GMP phosphodiesterase class II)
MATRGRSAPSKAFLPQVLLATFVVAVLPVLAVSAVQAAGLLRSTALAVAAAMLLSLAASMAGSALWMRRPASRDLVFADLMIWGWIRRLRVERRLSRATELLGKQDKLSPGRQAALLEDLSAALEARDPYTHGHSRRVSRHAHMIARRMGLSREQVAKIRTAAAVHDVGKLRTPRSLLNKPGALTAAEFAAIRLHSQHGAQMVASMGDPELTAMVRHHHERLDGGGYPDGLAGSDIPLGARIIAVADTFDAITSSRPYRAAGRHKNAIEVLKQGAGTQLDSDAVAAFRSYYTGRRSSLAWSAVVAGAPQRLIGWLGGLFQGAGPAPLAKGLSAVGATALIGGSLAAPAAPPDRGRDERAAGADRAVAVAPIGSARSGADRRADRRDVRRSNRGRRRRPVEADGVAPGSRSPGSSGPALATGPEAPGPSSPGSSGGGGGSPGGGTGSGGGSSGGSPGGGTDVPRADAVVEQVSDVVKEVEVPDLDAIPVVDVPKVEPPPVQVPPVNLPRGGNLGLGGG